MQQEEDNEEEGGRQAENKEEIKEGRKGNERNGCGEK